jgi:hypothetical protein
MIVYYELRRNRPKAVHLPAYGALVIPYRWMLRESGFDLAAELELLVDPENEPKEPMFLQNTAWVQHHDHQKALLDAFAAPLVEQSSLVLFYATRTSLCDDERRVILGAAVLEKKHAISEYDYEPANAPAQGRGIAYGIFGAIASTLNRDSEGDSHDER